MTSNLWNVSWETIDFNLQLAESLQELVFDRGFFVDFS